MFSSPAGISQLAVCDSGALRLVAWAKDLRCIGLGSGAKRAGVELPQLEGTCGSTLRPSLYLIRSDYHMLALYERDSEMIIHIATLVLGMVQTLACCSSPSPSMKTERRQPQGRPEAQLVQMPAGWGGLSLVIYLLSPRYAFFAGPGCCFSFFVRLCWPVSAMDGSRDG